MHEQYKKFYEIRAFVANCHFFMKYIVTIAALLLLAVVPLKAQENATELQLLHHSNGSSVALRWAPTNRQTFAKGVKHGYCVVRKTMVRDSSILPVEERTEVALSSSIIFPYTEEQVSRLVEQEPKAAMVYEALYGESTKGMQTVNSFSIIQKKREADMVFGLALFSCDLSPEVAKAAGLYAVDEHVALNERYLYMVSLAQEATDTAAIFVVPTDTTLLPKPLDLRVKFGDRVATLEWNTLLYHGVFSAYMVERSNDGKDFQPVSKEVIVGANQEGNATNVVSYQDSLSQNEVTYYYRLRGFSPFGVYGEPSDVVQGKGEVSFTVSPQVDSATLTSKNDVTLRWSCTGDLKQVKGYIVERAPRMDSLFVPLHKGLLSAKAQQLTQKKVEKGGYYRVIAVGFYEKHRHTSFPYYVHIPNDVPPTAPTGLAGSIDTLGIVRLTWKLNPESDVAGYRVFAANSPNGLFVDQCTQTLTIPFFTDTLSLSTLTTAIYYRVLAIDHSYNYSLHSAPLKLSKPDTIPPTAPRITSAQQQAKGLLLNFTPSHSADISSYQLYYSLSEKDSLRLIRNWSTNILPAIYTLNQFSDSISEVYLWLFALDHAKNKSRSQSYLVQMSKSKPCTLELKYKVGNNEITLFWKTPPCQVRQYRLYKGAGSAPATLLRTLPADALEYLDKEVTHGVPYRYILEAVSPEVKKAAEIQVTW
jgi:hypothetical protein